MFRLRPHRCLIIGLFIGNGVLSNAAIEAQDVKLASCIATPEDEAKIPAEEAGVLSRLTVKEGSLVAEGTLMGNIDDRQALLQRDAALAGWKSAYERYKSEVEVKYAQKNAEVAQAAYEKMVEANKTTKSAFSEIELRKAKLEWDTALLQIEKATKDREIALLDSGAKKAEYDLGEVGIKHRAIVAPFNGVVVKLERNQSEWVSPGDTILRLMRLEVMRVEGRVLQSKYDPQELYDCEVTVEVPLAHDRTESFPGRVALVSPLLEGTGTQLSYMVRAEVQNRVVAGQYLLRPYSQPTMTIHLGTARSGGPAVGLRDTDKQ